jgi:hypothetical protein
VIEELPVVDRFVVGHERMLEQILEFSHDPRSYLAVFVGVEVDLVLRQSRSQCVRQMEWEQWLEEVFRLGV